MTKDNELCPFAHRAIIGPDHKWNQDNYKIEDYTCPYCGLTLDKEKEVYCVMDSKTHTARLAHKKCIDDDPEWKKVEKDWEEILKGAI